MPVLSKLGALGPTGCRLALLNYNRNSGGTLLAEFGRQMEMTLVRQGHGHVFRRRQGQLTWNRFKDRCHFYFICVGVAPCVMIMAYAQIIYGQCELADYPTEGPPPRIWEFERTPLRRFFKWLTCYTDMEYTESNMSLLARCNVKNKWRLLEKRVKHLQGERLDYKAYYYHPQTNEWVELGKRKAKWHSTYLPGHGHTHGSAES